MTSSKSQKSANCFKFTAALITKRCLPPRPDETTKTGKSLKAKLCWDTSVPGFGVVARPRSSSFIFQHDLLGKSRKLTIGRVGIWTVDQARERARALRVEMDRGVDPNAEKRRQRAITIPLIEALTRHADDMRRRDCASRSIQFVEKDVPKYLSAWMRRPLTEVTKIECVELHAKLSTDRGPMIANKVLKAFGAAFRTASRVYDHLPDVPPTIAIRWNPSRRRREPIPWEKLPAWWRQVQSLRNPIRRDLQLTMFLTGLRSGDARNMRWKDIDMMRQTLHLPKPKGGVDRAFTIPLCKDVMTILRQRRRENEVFFPGAEWVFPTRRRNDSVWHVVEAKQLATVRNDQGRESKVAVLPTPHRLRDTYLTAARECHLRELDIKTLANHALPCGDVTQDYIRPDIEHLRGCAEKVATFLLRRVATQGYGQSSAQASGSADCPIAQKERGKPRVPGTSIKRLLPVGLPDPQPE